MKGTDNFKKVIMEHLELRAKEDSLFAETLKKPNKNIDDCITYILNTVQESGCIGFSDEEVYQMAVHYYDEDDLKPGKAVNCKVVVNHVVEVSEEEKAQAKQAAIDKIVEEEKAKLLKKEVKKKVVPATEAPKLTEQTSLF
jgi:hypothetical protein